MSALGEHRSALEEPLLIGQASEAQQKSHQTETDTSHDNYGDDQAAHVFPSFPDRQRQRRNRRGLWTLLLLLALMTLGTRLFSLPLNRVVEMRYCRAYCEEHDPALLPPAGSGAEIPEELCKVKEVQQRLAWLQGVVETLVIGIDLAVTMPLGWVGDRFGRKVVLACNAVGFGFLVVWVVLVGEFRVDVHMALINFSPRPLT